MPDPRRETVSASQVAALFDASPYMTRFTLWHTLAGTLPDVDDSVNDRMEWGNRLEPAILAAAGERRNLIVTPNAEYRRHDSAPIGCTIDGEALDPNEGPGIVEAKAVDWMVWKDQWTDDTAPPHIELQVQAQLAVRTDCRWSDIACLVGGNDFRVYPRRPDAGIIAEIRERAAAFMQSIRDGEEPSVTGSSVEDPFIAARWPQVREEPVLDLTTDREAWEIVRQYRYWTTHKSAAEKELKRLKPLLLGLTQDHAQTRVWGHRVEVGKSEIAPLEIGLPDDLWEALDFAMNAERVDLVREAIEAIGRWTHTVRAGSIQTRIKVKPIEGEPDANPIWGDDFDAELVL